jgi:hypothetical protein
MDALDTNASNITRFDQFTPTGVRTYGGKRESLPAEIVSVGPYEAEPLDYFGPENSRTAFTLTTAGPHGYRTGEIVETPAIRDIPCADGRTLTVPAGHVTHIRVLSPTSFAGSIYTNGGARTVASTVPRSGACRRDVEAVMPLDDIADLCNELDADCWVCVPHALEDAGVAAMADALAARLAPGRRAYVEYSNECWNYGLSFLQTSYCDGLGKLHVINGRPWYAKRAGEVHAIFAARFAAAGRPGDLVRLFASQAVVTTSTSQVVNYAHAHGLPLDAFAVAPYFNAGPNDDAFAPVYDAMDIDQIMDVSALSIARFPADLLAAQRDVVRAKYPDARIICYEGSMQKGIPASDLTSLQVGVRSRAWNRHPRIAEQTLRYLQNMQDAGADLFCYFELNMFHGPGAGVNNWGIYPGAWDMQDGLGDGSDGKFDNRTDYDRLDRIVSVVGHALKRWYAMTAPRAAAPARRDPPAHPPRITPAQIRRTSGLLRRARPGRPAF